MSRRTPLLLTMILVVLQAGHAQIPHTLSYQGLLADTSGTPKPDGSYNFTFRLYTVSSGGSAIWNETKSSQVKRGLFSTVLGSVTPIPDSVKFDRQYWLGVQVAADPELSPRMQLASVGSSINSLRSDVAQTVPDGSITGGKIASGQVVKSINNLHDNLTMRGANGASVTTNGDTITVTASGGGGGGIGTIQNTDNALNIINPAGPTTTVNLKIPFTVNGNVGIGTTTPQGLLDINSGSGGLDASALFVRADPGVFGRGGIIHHQSSTYGWQELAQTTGSATDGYLAFHYVNRTAPGTKITSNVLALRGNGNVGIGTTTPDQRLTVGGGSPADTKIKVDAGGNTYAGLQLANNQRRWNWQVVPSNDTPGGRLRLTEEVGNAEWMTITGAGNVGIGVTNPTVAKVHVDGGGGTAVYCQSAGSYGLLGYSALGTAVGGHGVSSYGVAAYSENNDGIFAQTNHPDHAAVFAQNLYGTPTVYLGTRYHAVEAHSGGGGPGENAAIYAVATDLANDAAGRFYGAVEIYNNLIVHGNSYVLGDFGVLGNKNFKIDHPLDPANKYLFHSCVESNQPLLIYSGNVITDAQGNAEVTMPSYFEALNINYRYQLTVVGNEFAQARVSEEIHENRFSIMTDKPNIKISWQVTGERNDAYSKAHPYIAEQDKKPEDRGKYLAPELFGQPKEMGIGYRPPHAMPELDKTRPAVPLPGDVGNSEKTKK